MKFKIPFMEDDYEVEMHTSIYENNHRLYVGLVDCADGGIFCDVSSNFPLEPNIEKDEFALKSWGGLEQVAEFLLEKGIVEDTGKIAFSGHVSAQICKLGANYKPD